jgi:hypothetical protein
MAVMSVAAVVITAVFRQDKDADGGYKPARAETHPARSVLPALSPSYHQVSGTPRA